MFKKKNFSDKIQFFAKGMDLTESIKEYILEKLAKLNNKDLVESINVEVGQTIAHRGVNKDFYVKFLLKVPNVYIRVKKVGDDLYKLIDEAVDVLISKLERYVDDLHKWQGKEEWPEISTYIDDSSSTYTPVDVYSPVVRKKKITNMTPISVQEAIFRMELLDLPCFMFRSIKDNDVKVVYKDKDGEYVLLESD